MDLAQLDALPAEQAAETLRPACASDAWVAALVAERPYPGIDAVLQESDAAIDALGWDDVEQALAAHPRIGDRAAGSDAESRWSREEQSAAATGEDEQAALRRGNVDYEQRFGHVFLICATGRSATQVLAALHERLDNDPVTEQAAVRRELAAIARLRLTKLLT